MASTDQPLLVDAHQLGLGATGNETWARCVVAALEADGGPPPTYAVSARGGELLPAGAAGRAVRVSGSSARRLLTDLPRVVRRLRPAALVVQYTLPLVRVPGVVAVHDLSFEDPASRDWLSSPTRERYRRTISWSVRRAGAVLTPTEWTRQDVLARYDVEPERVLVAPCAVDPQLLAALVAAPVVRDREPVVLCVGTVLPRKNLAVVARAVVRLRAGGVPVVLRLVGPVPPAGNAVLAELRELLPNGLEVRGAVSAEGLVDAYRTASVLAFPSRFEGFGIPVLEAMAAELPVVCSTATCLPEVAGDAAVLVGPDDVESWAAALSASLDGGPAVLARVRAGVARAGRFSWASTARAVRTAAALATD
jgi:glycosyltransferase involved in cell wall biosynthesis